MCVLFSLLKSLIIHKLLLIILGLKYDYGLLDFITAMSGVVQKKSLVIARFLQLAMYFLHALLERTQGLGFLRV
jgi:hypothetical protein